MLNIFLIFSILYQAPVLAYQYFYFDQEKISISKEFFTRYVLPQLRSIDQEFYTILKKIEPLSVDVIQIKKQVSSMKRSWEVGKEVCASTKDCGHLLSQIKKDSLELEKMISYYREHKLSGSKAKDQSVLERLIAVSEPMDNLTLTNYRLQHKLENRILDGIDAEILKKERYDKISITNLLKEMAFYAETIMVDVIDEKFNSLFKELWNNFINPIEDYVLTKGTQEYIEHNLGPLNIGWGSFHMHMERGNLDVPSNILNTITIMRQRWNSILKIYLKNTKFHQFKEEKDNPV